MMNYRAGSEEFVFGSRPRDVYKYKFAPLGAAGLAVSVRLSAFPHTIESDTRSVGTSTEELPAS